MTKLFLVFLSLSVGSFLGSGCASQQRQRDEKPDAISNVLNTEESEATDNASDADDSNDSTDSDTLAEEKVKGDEPWILTGLPSRKDLKYYDVINIDLPHADIEIHGKLNKKKGTVHVTRLRGGTNCMVAVAENKNALSITDAPRQMINSIAPKKVKKNTLFPSGLECHFRVEMHLPKSGNLNIRAQRGAVFVGNWRSDVSVNLQWGDIDFERINNINVECGSCTLTGNQVYGQVDYKMQNGNVGIEGLGGTVNGSTLGDTVLKWRRVESNSKISLSSKQGDIVLSIPRAIPLAIDLSVPRGNITASQGRRRIKNIRHSPNGVPLSVNVEKGNLRLYRK